MRQGLPSPPRPLRPISSERRHFCRLSLNVRPMGNDASGGPPDATRESRVLPIHLRGERGVGLREFLEGKARPTKVLTEWTNWTNVSAMKTVNVHEAKTNFSSLLATVEDSSESFVICRNGEPVADLVPHKRASRIKPHPVLSRIKIKYDPVETASESEWPGRFR